MNALLLAIKVPKEVALVLAILGGIFIVVVVLFFLGAKLGKKGSLAVGAVVLALIAAFFANQWLERARAEEEYLAGKEKSDRLAAVMKALPGESTFEAACQRAGPWNIEELVLVYTPPRRGEGQRHVTFSAYQDSVYGSDDSTFPRKPGLSVAVVAQDDRAAVVEIASGKVVCGGKLPVGFSADFYGGFDKNVRGYMAALEPICARLGSGFCARVEKAKQTPSY